MDREGSWGTEVEMLTLAHFLQTPVLVYNTEHEGWSRYSPRNVDVALDDDVTQMSMYLWHPLGTLRLCIQYATVRATDAVCRGMAWMHC